MKNDSDIEDIIQDSFIEFFKDVEHLRTTIKSYLTISSKHNALDFLKKNQRIYLVDAEKLDYVVDDSFTKKQNFLDNERFNLLLAELNKFLLEEEVQIILLHLVDDLKFDDIALKLKLNVKTIKTKYYRALKKYRKAKGVK